MARFKSLTNGFFRRRGLIGDDILVRCEGGALHLRGSEAGELVIPAAKVDKLRQFRTGAIQELQGEVPSIYETKIWFDGGSKPAMLTPYEQHGNYRTAMRDFAAAIVALRGFDRLYCGPGMTTAIINLILIGVPVLGLFAYMLWVSMEDGGVWWLLTAVLAVFFSFVSWRVIYARWPRPVRSMEEFEAQLR